MKLDSSIMNFLMYDYSICFKQILLEAIEQACKENADQLILNFKILSYIFELLQHNLTSPQLSTIIKILTFCSQIKNIEQKWLER